MNHHLYSFGGSGSGWLCSMERVDCRRVVSGEAAQWETLDLTANAANPPIKPRYNAIMAPIGPSSILIAGGFNRGDGRLGDGFIVEPEKNTVKKVIDQSATQFTFSSLGNQCQAIDSTKIIALVQDQNWVLHMVKFSFPTNRMTILKTFGK